MISLTNESYWLLAARPVWGRFDHERPSFDATHLWTLLSIVALLVAFAVVAYRSSRRAQKDFTDDSPAKLFRELCHAHRLPLRSRRLLKRLATARGGVKPATLFVESEHFDPASLPSELQPAAAEILRIRARLFH